MTYTITYQPKRTKLSRPFKTEVDADDRAAAEAFFHEYYPKAEMLSIHPKK